MILSHQFDEENHIYKVDGYFVLSTSDVKHLNGLEDFGQVPRAVLDHASWRGTQLHRSVQFVEEAVHEGEKLSVAAQDMMRQLTGNLEEVKPYLMGYLRCRQQYELEIIPPQEKQIVYLHNDTAIGCTIDLRCRIHGKGYQGIPAIGDLKTTSKQYGKALQQKRLAWRMQTQSYKEATQYDEEFWSYFGDSADNCSRFVCQVNKEGSFEFHCFRDIDDEARWAACVEVAAMKLANGHKLDQREEKVAA
jgi:hypothetical protein